MTLSSGEVIDEAVGAVLCLAGHQRHLFELRTNGFVPLPGHLDRTADALRRADLDGLGIHLDRRSDPVSVPPDAAIRPAEGHAGELAREVTAVFTIERDAALLHGATEFELLAAVEPGAGYLMIQRWTSRAAFDRFHAAHRPPEADVAAIARLRFVPRPGATVVFDDAMPRRDAQELLNLTPFMMSKALAAELGGMSIRGRSCPPRACWT